MAPAFARSIAFACLAAAVILKKKDEDFGVKNGFIC